MFSSIRRKQPPTTASHRLFLNNQHTRHHHHHMIIHTVLPPPLLAQHLSPANHSCCCFATATPLSTHHYHNTPKLSTTSAMHPPSPHAHKNRHAGPVCSRVLGPPPLAAAAGPAPLQLISSLVTHQNHHTLKPSTFCAPPPPQTSQHTHTCMHAGPVCGRVLGPPPLAAAAGTVPLQPSVNTPSPQHTQIDHCRCTPPPSPPPLPTHRHAGPVCSCVLGPLPLAAPALGQQASAAHTQPHDLNIRPNTPLLHPQPPNPLPAFLNCRHASPVCSCVLGPATLTAAAGPAPIWGQGCAAGVTQGCQQASGGACGWGAAPQGCLRAQTTGEGAGRSRGTPPAGEAVSAPLLPLLQTMCYTASHPPPSASPPMHTSRG
jgi:hypothetical protein